MLVAAEHLERIRLRTLEENEGKRDRDKYHYSVMVVLLCNENLGVSVVTMNVICMPQHDWKLTCFCTDFYYEWPP